MASPPRERPRLNLKPRDETAAKAAAERSASSKASPFGAAKPREAVLATRLGTDERSVLAEELKKERLNLRLNKDQVEQREQAEAGIQELKTSIHQEDDAEKQAALKEELTSREQKLEEMLDGFQKLAVEQAKSGEGVRPSDRRRQLEQRMLQQGSGETGGHYGSPAGAQGGYFPQQYGASGGGRGGRAPSAGAGGSWGSGGGRGAQGGSYSDAGFYDQPSSFGGFGGDQGGNRRQNSGGPPRDQGRGGYGGGDRGGGAGYDPNGYGGGDHGGYQQPERTYQPQDRY
ncbi:hypothetical protein WJX73_006653 [Symbiochloris irregularis]|uniref:Uncharacterized protein n=1 Tax=Symbiochloris irregularis TaxID=706552 RepID=A0AAW1PLS8_9CHLO